MRKILGVLFLMASLSFGYHSQISEASKIILGITEYTEAEATHIASIVYDNAVEHELDYSYVLAIIMTESRFNYRATSYCGAKGLMQIMPKTFTSIAKKNDLNYSANDMYDIEKNVKIGCLYLNYLATKYSKLDYVSAGYNGGPGVANKYKAGNYDVVPYQTMVYVRKVKEYHRDFSAKLNKTII